jgi:hypothetical protein
MLIISLHKPPDDAAPTVGYGRFPELQNNVSVHPVCTSVPTVDEALPKRLVHDYCSPDDVDELL